MATIHNTTMTPSKLELLATWLPKQDWYVGPAAPELRRAGGFRLDDPAGEVGVEFVFVNAIGAEASVTYHVPMTYRGAPRGGADQGLIGTSEHGVLGSRWIYDGAQDPVLQEQLTELLLGRVRAQHQSRSDEVDQGVVVRPVPNRDVGREAQIRRVLDASADDAAPGVSATWEAPDGTTCSGVVVGLVT